MQQLLNNIRACKICEEHLPLGPRPIVQCSEDSKILIIGQAPGTKVHQSGIPWDDASGRELRKWLNVDSESFYNVDYFGIMPMGFCYPGKGKSGDLPPRPECAAEWHHKLKSKLSGVKLTLLIGQYAQRHYLKGGFKENLTKTVQAYEEYLPDYIPLPHPSPRNRFWLTKNPWFKEELIPILQEKVFSIL